MATEILNGPVTGPYRADDGDIIVVSGDALVTSDVFNAGAIENRTASDTGISIFVDGRIRNTGDYGDAIRLVGENPGAGEVSDGSNLVEVRQDGSITGFHGINLIWGQDNAAVVEGRVAAQHTAINVEDASVSLDIGGTVTGGYNALLMFDASGSSLINSGRMLSDLGAMYIQDTSSMTIANSGLVRGDHGGITFVDGQDLSILNTGVIATKFPTSTYSNTAVELIDATGFLLENLGRIESGLAIRMYYSAGTIDNSGKIIGLTTGLQISPVGIAPDEQVTILNSGLIRAETSLRAHTGQVNVTNSGVMIGDITATDAWFDLTNSGRIAGSVKFGYRDDTYLAIGDGFVTEFVLGGGGQDVLTGGSRKDDLRGGTGDDILKGKGGKDVLRGNAGDDILEGGGDNDVLIGGGGEDIFVFAPNSGTDRVTDFQDTRDSLRIADHAGGFDTLAITDKGADLKIIHDGGVILLEGQAGIVLTFADFDFV